MAIIYMYVLGASSNPDKVECGVPWGIGDDEVFFGPCKKHLRAALRRLLLGPETEHVAVSEEIHFVGFNALKGGNVRKIVWAGRMREAMSFGHAYVALKAAKYKKMRDDPKSPLHVKPIGGPEGRPLGYERISDEHVENAAWLRDLATKSVVKRLRVTGDSAELPQGVSWWRGFERDICFLFDQCFLARGDGRTGLAIDNELVAILKEAQKDRTKIDCVAVFGRNGKGWVDGRTGGYLKLTGPLADHFLEWLVAAHPCQPAPASAPTIQDRTPAAPKGDRKPSRAC